MHILIKKLISSIFYFGLCFPLHGLGSEYKGQEESSQRQLQAKRILKFNPELSQSLIRLSDQAIHISEPDSKLKLIQFWASWCHSCGTILWDFDQLLSQHSTVEYIAVSIDEEATDALDYIKSHALYEKYQSHFYHDSKLLLKQHFEVETIPTILILDQSGSVAFRHRGHMNSSDLNALNQTLIKAKGISQ